MNLENWEAGDTPAEIQHVVTTIDSASVVRELTNQLAALGLKLEPIEGFNIDCGCDYMISDDAGYWDIEEELVDLVLDQKDDFMVQHLDRIYSNKELILYLKSKMSQKELLDIWRGYL